jgi:glycolate oxidase FAD binding subunit
LTVASGRHDGQFEHPTSAPGRADRGNRYGFGTPRDRLTGITAVRADGTIVASTEHAAVGGRDLVTLLAGSFGSLGLITEATFRLEPTPQVSGGITLNCDDPAHAERLVEGVSDPWIAPMGRRRWPGLSSR